MNHRPRWKLITPDSKFVTPDSKFVTPDSKFVTPDLIRGPFFTPHLCEQSEWIPAFAGKTGVEKE